MKTPGWLRFLQKCFIFFSRADNKLCKYLNSSLSVAKLHRFLNIHDNKKVSYDMSRRIFVEEYNVAFGYPRKDICKERTRLPTHLQHAEVTNDERSKNSLVLAKELHLRKAESFKLKLAEATADKDPNVLAICFDYQKNLPVPVTNIADEYYLRQLWIHNFGIHCLNTRKSTISMYAEHFAQKGPNVVISCLEDFINRNKTGPARFQSFLRQLFQSKQE